MSDYPDPNVEPFPGWLKLVIWSIGGGLGVAMTVLAISTSYYSG